MPNSIILALVPILTGILAIALMFAITFNKFSTAKQGLEETNMESKKPSRDRFPGRRQGGGGHALEDDDDASTI